MCLASLHPEGAAGMPGDSRWTNSARRASEGLESLHSRAAEAEGFTPPTHDGLCFCQLKQKPHLPTSSRGERALLLVTRPACLARRRHSHWSDVTEGLQQAAAGHCLALDPQGTKGNFPQLCGRALCYCTCHTSMSFGVPRPYSSKQMVKLLPNNGFRFHFNYLIVWCPIHILSCDNSWPPA